MSFTMLPSPPKTKTIERPSDVKKVIEQINNIKKIQVPNKKKNGWEILIHIYGEEESTISYRNGLLFIDNACYIIFPGEITKIRSLCEEMME